MFSSNSVTYKAGSSPSSLFISKCMRADRSGPLQLYSGNYSRFFVLMHQCVNAVGGNKSKSNLPQAGHFNTLLFAIITVPLHANIPGDSGPAWDGPWVKVYLINIYYQATGMITE